MKNLVNPVKLLFAAASDAPLPHIRIPTRDRACAHLRPEVSLVIVKPQVLQTVSHHALNVPARLFETVGTNANRMSTSRDFGERELAGCVSCPTSDLIDPDDRVWFACDCERCLKKKEE